jgi:AcrR family transcriptional regulator
MSRQRPQHREDLLDAVIEYMLDHGVADLSLRPLAAHVGSKARLLIYHFGSRDALIADAMIVIRERVQRAFADMVDRGRGRMPSQIMQTFWEWATSREHERYLRLFFEVHGLALQKPSVYGLYLEGAVKTWVEMMAAVLPESYSHEQRIAFATLAVGTTQGLLLDYLTSGDQRRPAEALRLFAQAFDQHILPGSRP